MLSTLALFCCANAPGIATDAKDDTAPPMALPIVEGTPLAVGIVRLVNDPATTADVLDHDVPLDARAAQGLAAAKTERPFDLVVEIDKVPYVGAAALQALANYAWARGFVPEGSDVLGTWDGVTFTADEAAQTVAFVNQADAAFLDHDLRLDSRAVQSIKDARPVASVFALSKLYYVGSAALGDLRAHVLTLDPRDCRTDEDCGDADTSCLGIPHDGSTDKGQCVSRDQLDFSEASCTTTSDCPSDEVCLGEFAFSRWGDAGWCVSAWMSGTFTSDAFVEIPGGGTASSIVPVYGLATVPVDIVLDLSGLEAADPSRLRVELHPPHGGDAQVWSGSDVVGNALINASSWGDETVNGAYELRLIDEGGAGATLHGWSLYIVSNWD